MLVTATAAQMAEPIPTDPKPAMATGVKEVKPQVFYLKDKDGNLLPVPDMTLEDFKRLYDLSQGLNVEPPAYSLRSVKITGQVREGKAELEVELVIVTTAKDGTWARVPLRFNSSVLREAPQHDGKGEIFLDYEPDGEGYVCWLKAAEQSEHTLRCKFLAKVHELGAESRIALVAPRATSGSLSLRVPASKAKARAIRRTEEPELEVVADGQGSRIEMLGPAGEFQIAWRVAAGAAATVRQTIEATGNMLVKLEGKRRMTAEARLKLRSFGPALETIMVRLPPGMRLVPLDQPGIQLTVLEPEIDEVSKKQVQIVEVRLATKTNGPVDVQLVAEYLREAGSADAPVEVGGFEVVDAVKQTGVIDLVVEGDQSAIWLEGANVRRIDEVLAADARGVKPLARFDYDAQPFSLQIQVVPRKTRVTVEPLYVVYVENQQLRLDATLKYKVRGAKTFNIEHNFDGWTIDRVGPDALVQSESLLPERASPLSIPLVAAAVPATGEFELKVQAHRDLPIDASELKFDVPRPVGGNLTPGSLVIVPADNVDLATRLADLQGLVADPLPTNIKLPPRQQTPQFYRELGGGAVARFAAGIDLRKRMVSVASSGDVRLDLGRAAVEQRLTYNIAYEPLRNVELEVPAAVWEAGQVQILLDGNSLPVALIPAEKTAVNSEDSRLRVRVDLMSDRIGRMELDVRYPIPLPTISDAPVDMNVPLVAPIVDNVAVKSSVSVRVIHADRLDVASKDESWAMSQPMQSPDPRGLEVTWTHATGATQLPLTITLQQQGNAGLVTIDQAWLQTWLDGDRRQDRAVFRVTTAADRLRIQMPDEVRDANLLTAVDGRRVSRRLLDAEGVLTIELPSGNQNATHVIELWYDTATEATPAGVLALATPRVQGAGEARRAYWQLVLPAGQQMVAGPDNLSTDMRWEWLGTYFGRVGRLSQVDLERWSGATAQAELPSSAHTILFSSFGSLPEIEVRIVSRRSVILACSGLILVAGLALLYLPLLRHPLVLLVVGVGIGAMAVWNPDAAIATGQAAAAGLLCVLLARVLLSLYGQPAPVPVGTRGPSPSGIEAKSTEPHMRYDPGSQATTATAPLLVTTPAEPET